MFIWLFILWEAKKPRGSKILIEEWKEVLDLKVKKMAPGVAKMAYGEDKTELKGKTGGKQGKKEQKQKQD